MVYMKCFWQFCRWLWNWFSKLSSPIFWG